MFKVGLGWFKVWGKIFVRLCREKFFLFTENRGIYLVWMVQEVKENFIKVVVFMFNYDFFFFESLEKIFRVWVVIYTWWTCGGVFQVFIFLVFWEYYFSILVKDIVNLEIRFLLGWKLII